MYAAKIVKHHMSFLDQSGPVILSNFTELIRLYSDVCLCQGEISYSINIQPQTLVNMTMRQYFPWFPCLYYLGQVSE